MLLQEFNVNPTTLKPNARKAVPIKNDDNIEKLKSFIDQHCSEFLKIAKQTDAFLYRGIKEAEKKATFLTNTHDDKFPLAFIGHPRADRYAVDNSKYSNEAMHESSRLMALAGFTALRNNSLFCNSGTELAHPWGELYVIFPCNGFTFGYSTSHTGEPAEEYKFPSFNARVLIISLINTFSSLLHGSFLGIKVNAASSKTLIKFLKDAQEKGYKYNSDYLTLERMNFFMDAVNKFMAINKIELDGYKTKIYNEAKNFLTIMNDPKKEAEWFIKKNKLTNKNLSWAMKNEHDVWILGSYVAIQRDFFLKNASKLYFGVSL